MQELDLEAGVARCTKEEVDYYTEPLIQEDVRILHTFEEKRFGEIRGVWEVQVSEEIAASAGAGLGLPWGWRNSPSPGWGSPRKECGLPFLLGLPRSLVQGLAELPFMVRSTPLWPWPPFMLWPTAGTSGASPPPSIRTSLLQGFSSTRLSQTGWA